MQTREAVKGLHNFREFSQPPKSLNEAMQTRKKYSSAVKKKFSRIRANSKGHNRVYILSSKRTYRPMRAFVVSQLFYRMKSKDTNDHRSYVHNLGSLKKR